MILQSSKLLLLYDFNRFIPTLYGQLFLFWSKLQRFPYMEGVSFFGNLVEVLTLFSFSVICSEYFLQTTCRLSRGLDPSRELSGDVRLDSDRLTTRIAKIRVYSDQCIKIGYSSGQCFKIGYSSGQCIKIGYSSVQCIKIGCSSAQWIKIGYSSAQCIKIGYSSVMY